MFGIEAAEEIAVEVNELVSFVDDCFCAIYFVI